MCTSSRNNKYGFQPVTIQWSVIRGDTSPLRIEFLDNDEVTHFNTTDWTYQATSYDPKSDILDILEVTAGEGYVDILAPSSITENWGIGYQSVVNELSFDLQVTIDGDTVWTPVIGTISVIGDITGNTL